MIDTVSLFFIFACTIIILGVLGEEFFKRTGIADTLFLLILGFLLGQVFGIIQHSQVMPIVPYFSAIALIFILFDGGLNIDLVRAVKGAPRAVIMAIVGFALAVILTAFVTKIFLEMRLIHGILLGATVGGSSSITVLALSSILPIHEKTRALLILESAITDVLCAAGVFALLPSAISLRFELEPFIYQIAHSTIIGLGVGGTLGIIWFIILSRLSGSRHAYMLTLSILLGLYVIARYFGGTGALSALFFGLILGNEKYMFRIIKRPFLYRSIEDSVKRFHGEISFIIRTFFFILMGLIATITDIWILFVGAVLCLTLLGARVISVNLTMVKSELASDKDAIQAMLARGLAAAVLATFLMSYNIPGSEFLSQIVFIVIFGTTLISTLMLVPFYKNARKYGVKVRVIP